MSDDYIPTVRIRRPSRVKTDGGRNVWEETIETAQLELVSTTQLQTILASDDEESRSAIQKVLTGNQEGLLARDPATGLFEVISDEDLQAILDNDDTPPIVRRAADVTLAPDRKSGAAEAEELSLVSTQMLRKIIRPEEKPPAKRPAGLKPADVKDRSGGFDPYNSG